MIRHLPVLRLLSLLLALPLLPATIPAAHAQSPGTLSLSGPSTGGQTITPASLSAAVNAALAKKADVASPTFTGTVTAPSLNAANAAITGNATVAGSLTVPANPSLSTCPTANCPLVNPVLSTLVSQGTTQSATNQEWQVNLGLLNNTGQANQSQKVTLYAGMVQTPTGSNGWAMNTDIVRNATNVAGSTGGPAQALVTGSIAGNTLTVSAVSSGTVTVGQWVEGAGATNAQITAQGTGTGGIGTYTIGGTAQTIASEPFTIAALPNTVPSLGYECDFTNWDQDATVGTGPFTTCIYIHNSSSYRSLAGIYFDATMAAGKQAWQDGLLFSGSNLISDNTVYDGTNSTTSWQIAGTHTSGVNTTLATLTYAWQSAAGQKFCFAPTDACWLYSSGANQAQFLVGGQNRLGVTTTGGVTTGFGSTATGISSLALGQGNTASGNNGFSEGIQAFDRGRYASQAFSAGQFSTSGDAEAANMVLRGSTSSTSSARLTADAGTAGAANCANIPDNTAATITLDIVALDHTAPANNEAWLTWTGFMTRGTGAGSTAIAMNAAPTAKTNGTVTGSAIAATADTTNGCLNLTFTPPSGNADAWRVVARVATVEVQ